MMYATGHPDFGLGQLLREQGRFEEARTGSSGSQKLVVPNTLRLLEWARAHDMRRVFLTYGSEVADYSDLVAADLRHLPRHQNRKGIREHELLDELAPRAERARHQQDHPERVHLEPDRADHPHLRRKDLLFTGVSTNMCVEGTLRDAADRGSAASWSRTPGAPTPGVPRGGVLTVMQRLYGHVLSTDEVLDRLAGGDRAVRRRGGGPRSDRG